MPKTTSRTASKTANKESAVVADMKRGQEIAKKYFGALANSYAVREISEYLEDTEEEYFLEDLERMIAHVKDIYETTTPTPEDVFYVFDRMLVPE